MSYIETIKQLFPDKDVAEVLADWGLYLPDISDDNEKLSLVKRVHKKKMHEITVLMAEIHSAFNAAGIRYAFFKGAIIYADVYDPAASRFFEDIDLFVPQADVFLALDALGKLGYLYQGQPVCKENYGDYYRHIGNHLNEFYHKPSDTMLELHMSPIYCSLMDSEREFARLAEKYIYQNIRTVHIYSYEFNTFSVDITMLSLLEHLARHLVYAVYLTDMSPGEIDMPYRTLFDIYFSLNKYQTQIAWERIAQLCEEFKIGTRIRVALNAVCDFFKLSIDNEIQMIPLSDECKGMVDKVSVRLLKEPFFDLCRNQNNLAYIHRLFWSMGGYPVTEPIITTENGVERQSFILKEDSDCRFDAIPMLLGSYIENSPENHRGAELTCYMDQNSFCYDLNYFMPDPKRFEQYSCTYVLTLIIDLLEVSSVTHEKNVKRFTVDCGITHDGKPLYINNAEHDKYKAAMQNENDCVQIHGCIDSSLFLQNENSAVYYNFIIRHSEIGRRIVRNLRLWKYTPECDITTWNRFPSTYGYPKQ
jgi:hypothetical protein